MLFTLDTGQLWANVSSSSISFLTGAWTNTVIRSGSDYCWLAGGIVQGSTAVTMTEGSIDCSTSGYGVSTLGPGGTVAGQRWGLTGTRNGNIVTLTGWSKEQPSAWRIKFTIS